MHLLIEVELQVSVVMAILLLVSTYVPSLLTVFALSFVFQNGFDNNNDRNSVHGSNASVARSRRSSFVDEPIDEAVEFFVEESNGFDVSTTVIFCYDLLNCRVDSIKVVSIKEVSIKVASMRSSTTMVPLVSKFVIFAFLNLLCVQDGGNGFGSRQSVNDNQAFGSSSGFGAGAGFGGSQRFPSSHSIARSHASVAQSVGGQVCLF